MRSATRTKSANLQIIVTDDKSELEPLQSHAPIYIVGMQTALLVLYYLDGTRQLPTLDMLFLYLKIIKKKTVTIIERELFVTLLQS